MCIKKGVVRCSFEVSVYAKIDNFAKFLLLIFPSTSHGVLQTAKRSAKKGFS